MPFATDAAPLSTAGAFFSRRDACGCIVGLYAGPGRHLCRHRGAGARLRVQPCWVLLSTTLMSAGPRRSSLLTGHRRGVVRGRVGGRLSAPFAFCLWWSRCCRWSAGRDAPSRSLAADAFHRRQHVGGMLPAAAVGATGAAHRFRNGLGAGFLLAGHAGSIIGFLLAASLPALLTAALLFLTPMSFLVSTARNSSTLVSQLALGLGLVIGPVLSYSGRARSDVDGDHRRHCGLWHPPSAGGVAMSGLGALTPLLVLILVGFLPNEIWRMLGIVVARGIDEDSELIIWVRAVAVAILAAVIAKLVVVSPGALANVPLRCGSAPSPADLQHACDPSIGFRRTCRRRGRADWGRAVVRSVMGEVLKLLYPELVHADESCRILGFNTCQRSRSVAAWSCGKRLR